jgi:hypothetical protein
MATSVHSFKTIQHNNGNVTIVFYQGTKRRDIKLIKGTSARDEYVSMYNDNASQLYPDSIDDEHITRNCIDALREDYLFKKHDNNPSIFYPHSK